ncbi:MAG: coenzyme A pyrophosphatase, partial [Nitrospinaceae bacterium]|nr:coenzyme A pyrophosphatase [Nitrospinaceae bacterium]NIR57755.1 coenzyme A pyrophosphatase [Nitrospinaceae bacterium]NIS88215.1 coenzyme A pyrophosphatase [Nitrospinaceae bacterium]NIT85308.1 coenzyme A pyrophosphatase [Nitrospinaceae bacterium]NIU47254.1 coenzyme A pyrophosphatase [Nitrospinaceae bacterium]
MNLSQITTRLKTRFPVVRESVAAHPQVASVLVLLYARHGQAHVLMTKRADDLPLHPG